MKNTDQSIYELPVDQGIITAFSTKKIAECQPRELDAKLYPAVISAFKDIGKRDSESLQAEIKYIYDNLPNRLHEEVPNMRAGEIPIAFKRGLLKEFGEYYGLNVVELLRFCKSHYESELRANSVKSMLKPKKSIELPPSKEDQFELFKNNLLIAFDKNKAGNSIEVNGPSLYDFCDKLKLIMFSKTEKYEILNQAALAVIKDQHNILFVTVEDYKRPPFKKIIEIISAHLDEGKPLTEGIKDKIILKSKFLILKAFFAHIETQQLDLPEMAENKKDLFINES